MHSKTTILFDLGGVLLHLDYAGAWRRLAAQCTRIGPADFGVAQHLMIDHPATDRYETGRGSLDDLFAAWVDITGFTGPREEFEAAWCGIFSENRPMTAFAREMLAAHPACLWSNSNPLHMDYARRTFPFLQQFPDAALSYELGAKKPDPAFYRHALHRCRVDPAAAVFIDDRPENVDGARACGIPSIHYRQPEQAIREIRAALDQTAE